MADAAVRSDHDGTGADGAEPGTRRDFLELLAWSAMGVGAIGLAWPLVASMNPSADVLAVSSTEVKIDAIPEGSAITVTWRGSPVFVRHRTPQEIEEAKAVDVSTLRDPQTDEERVQKEPWLVVVGVCTHLGCVPVGNRPDRQSWRVRRLVLPLPRLAVRHRRAHPQGAGTPQPRRAQVCLRGR